LVWGEISWSGEKKPGLGRNILVSGEKYLGLWRTRLVWGEKAWSVEKNLEKSWSVEKKPGLGRKILKNLGLERKSLVWVEKS
jgi:hypothetical protein